MFTFLKFLSRVLSFLPWKLSLILGRISGLLFFIVSKKKKTQALKNLRLVFPQINLKELRKILLRSYVNFGMSIIETLRIISLGEDSFERHFQIENRFLLEECIKSKGILLGVHIGSWEFLNCAVARHFQYVVIVRRQKPLFMERFLSWLRRKGGLYVVYEDKLKPLYHHLKKGSVLGLVFDHGSSDSPLLNRFFGKVIPTPIGGLKLALRLKRKIYPVVMYRVRDCFHRVKLFNPLTLNSEDDFSEVATQLNRCFEEFIRQHPQDYFWWYKRFKRSRNFNILILSDKKPGHLRQSLSLVKLIKDMYPESSEEILEVKLCGFKRTFINFCNLFSSERCFGCLRCVRFILGRDFERFFKYADLIISCGASLSSLNRILSYGLGAKSFVIMKPSLFWKRHDLVILPQHDGPSRIKNLVFIKGALCFSPEEELKRAGENLRRLTDFLDTRGPKVGFFLGGPLRGNSYDRKMLKRFLEKIRALSREKGYRLLISTSRRTPAFVEDLLLKEFKEASLLIIANRKNYDFAVPGVIGLSDVVIVSSDSISMISESSFFRPTLVLDIFSALKKKKHRRFCSLLDRKFIKLSTPEDLAHDIEDILSGKLNLKRIDNRRVLKASLEKVLGKPEG